MMMLMSILFKRGLDGFFPEQFLITGAQSSTTCNMNKKGEVRFSFSLQARFQYSPHLGMNLEAYSLTKDITFWGFAKLRTKGAEWLTAW